MFSLRLRLMSALDRLLHQRSHDTAAQLVRADDEARVVRVGDQDEAIKNLRSLVG